MNLHILMLEDDPLEAILVQHELRHAGIEAELVRVVTRAEFEAQLDSSPDAILSDYHLPGWDGLRALRLVRERGLKVPFFLFSSSVHPDTAAEAIRLGADDCLSKDDLPRLVPALIAAVARAEQRSENPADETHGPFPP